MSAIAALKAARAAGLQLRVSLLGIVSGRSLRARIRARSQAE